MNDPKKITLSDLKKIYTELRIPEIQRDYVMGAGGKDDKGKDKLEKLLDAILAKSEANDDFDFSCIITYCSNLETERLEIYDGQQRLTTLMLMILYKLRSENKDDVVNEFKNWYRFMGRKNANEILDLLTNNESSIDKIEVTDFTSFSMKNLLEKIKLPKYESITSEYLLNRVKFDMVSIGSQNEIEQFFMDLNSGVKLKDYELYKAKLTHRVSQLKDKYTNSEVLELWSHKMDNNWLDFFDLFADYEHPAEEYEVAFVKYCFNMIFIEDEKDSVDCQIEGIDVDVIDKVYNIMQLITGLNLSFYKSQEKNQEKELLKLKKGMLYFSWGETDSDIDKKWKYDIRGAFWKLDFEEYDRMLYYVIKFVLLDTKKSIEMEKDVLLWCFIKTLAWQFDIQNEYLRLIKMILNHNVVENENAWYECQRDGQYLYYCKYYVYAIPQYYGEHLNAKIQDNEIKNRHSNMFILNKSLIQNVKISNMLNRRKIAIDLMEKIGNIEKNEVIAKIIDLRIQLITECGCYDACVKKENEVFGIIEKIGQPIEKDKKYYLEEVKFSWPIAGKNKESSLSCWIRLKCRTDFLFTDYNQKNHDIVKKTVNWSKEKFGEEFIDKCFWTESICPESCRQVQVWTESVCPESCRQVNKVNKVNKLVDRVTPTSTTYKKRSV